MPLCSFVLLSSAPPRLLSRPRLPQAVALAGLSLLMLAAGTAAQAQTFVLTASDYTSPTFVDNQGTFTFSNTGIIDKSFSFSTTPTTFFLDRVVRSDYDSTTKNSTPATVFTGTATTQLTITGLGTQTITQNYTLDGTTPTAKFGNFLAGSAVAFALSGGTQQLLITPIAGNTFRQATAQIVPLAPASVPEPSAALTWGLGALGLAALAGTARGLSAG